MGKNNKSFHQLKDKQEQLKILKEASKGDAEIWTKLPEEFVVKIGGSDGDVIYLNLIKDTGLDPEGINWEITHHSQEKLKAPFLVGLCPEDCKKLLKKKKIRVGRFLPHKELKDELGLYPDGSNFYGLKWYVYPLYLNDIFNEWVTTDVEISLNQLYVLSEGVEERNQKQSSGPRSPSQIFIHQQIASGVTDWKDAWSDIRKMADGKTSRTFNDCAYVLNKKNVPHPKSDGMIDAVEFDQETEPPKTITINKYSFRDSFQRLIKKK